MKQCYKFTAKNKRGRLITKYIVAFNQRQATKDANKWLRRFSYEPVAIEFFLRGDL